MGGKFGMGEQVYWGEGQELHWEVGSKDWGLGSCLIDICVIGGGQNTQTQDLPNTSRML